MKKKHFLHALIIMTICGCSNIDCTDFHNGEFNIIYTETDTSFIMRDGRVQIENNISKGYAIETNVEWIDECTYELSLIKIILDKKNELQQHKYPLVCNLVELNSDFALVEIKDNSENSYTIQMIRY